MIHTIILNQFCGCGDILFCISLARDFIKEGYKVIWPLESIYAPLAKHFPDIVMIDKFLVNIDYTRKYEYEYNGCKVIPLRFTDSLCKVPYTQCMASKFLYFGKNWEDWNKDYKIVRDIENEKRLYYEVLGLKDGEEYNLISNQFGKGGHLKNTLINVENGLKNVQVEFIPNFTLIDWMMVMENATEIHSISSSNIYLYENMELKAKSVNLYLRFPIERNHDNYSYLLKKHNYILHG